jgi:hypothetical protein
MQVKAARGRVKRADLKFLHSSGTRILWRRLAGGCLSRIRNTIAGEDVPPAAPPPSASAAPPPPTPPSTSIASPVTAASAASEPSPPPPSAPAPPPPPAATASWLCGSCCCSLGGDDAGIAFAVAGVALAVGFGGGVGTGLGFGAGGEEVIRTERDGTGGEEKGGAERGCLGHSRRPAVAVAGEGKGAAGFREDEEVRCARCAGVAFRWVEEEVEGRWRRGRDGRVWLQAR